MNRFMRTFARIFIACVMMAGIGINCANAGVVMQGTRVIISAGMQEKSIQFSNLSDNPFLVQAWASSSPDAKDEDNLPFVLTPPIFKLDARTGQTVRMRVLPSTGPLDTEQVYYLNFTQIPAVNPQEVEGNQLFLLMRTTTKIFYRPAHLKDGIPEIIQKLRFRIQDQTLEVENPTALHVNINSMRIESKGNTHAIEMKPGMIAPRETAQWPISPGATLDKQVTVHISSVNDYGAEVLTSIPIANE